MRRDSRRHPVLETVVFAAALLMTAYVARELWRRWRVPPSAASLSPLPALPRLLKQPPSPRPTNATERAVTAVPPLRPTRVERGKPEPAAVPAPR